MYPQPPFDPPSVRAAVARAIALKGSQDKLAAACGVTQAAISRANVRGRVSPHLTIAIHRATGGAVPGSLLRPDLWRSAQDVPVEGPAVLVEPQRPADASGASVDRGQHLIDGVGQGADGSQERDHGALFRLPERPDGVFVEIMACDASRQELDPGKAGAEHLSQVDRNDERTRVAHDRRHEAIPLAVRIRTANDLSANYSVDEKVRIVSLRISVVGAPERPRADRSS
jgi:DNA-binding transcriptional regulator YdaS (Cro superfamily)